VTNETFNSKQNMKTTTSLLLASAVALGFTLATARADEPFLSPRVAALRHDFRKVPSPDTSPNRVSNSYFGAAAKFELNRVRVVPTAAITPNLVSGTYAGAASKNPYPASTRFEIAPLVEKGKVGKPCEMSCCAKT